MRVGVLLLATTVRAIDPIRAHVITLDVYAPRYGDFLERNPHIVNDLQTWKGVDGRKMGYKKLIADGVMTQALVDSKQTSEGMGGVALSHRKIWEHVAATDELALVLEDDVYTHPDIALWGESRRDRRVRPRAAPARVHRERQDTEPGRPSG